MCNPFRVARSIKHVEGLSGHSLNPDEVVLTGSAGREVGGATVCWMATPDAIEDAARRGDDLVIGHESLYYPYGVLLEEDGPRGWQDWQVNRQRRELLEKHGLTFCRMHGSLDDICIYDDFASVLGLGRGGLGRRPHDEDL